MCVNAWYETSFILIYNNPLDIMLWFCTAEAMLLNIVLELSRNLFISIWVREERDIERKSQINNIARETDIWVDNVQFQNDNMRCLYAYGNFSFLVSYI